MNNFYANDVTWGHPPPTPGGWIYIMMTRRDGDRVKIGKTKNNPIDRLATLRCGDPYMAMIGAFYIPESKAKIKHVEKWLHDWFESRRIRFVEHIRPLGNRPAHTLDGDTLGAYSEWFRMDVLDAADYVHEALQECLGVDQIYIASWFCPGAYPSKLAYYTQEMLTEMFGRPIYVDDDYELGDEIDASIPW